MATAKLNPVIMSISGRFGNSVFYINRSRQCVRSYVVPRNPNTLFQKEVRKSFAEAVKSWQQISPEEKYAYIRKARGLGMSGYNLYISEFMTGKKAAQKKYKTSCAVSIFQANNTSFKHIHSVSIPYMLLCEAKDHYSGTGFG